MINYGRNPCPDVPLTIMGQEEYIKEAKTPFERLARLWEVEIRQSGVRGDADTKDEDGKRRWFDFWKIWDNTNPKEQGG